MRNLFKVRKMSKLYYVILAIVIFSAMGMNILFHEMNTTTCLVAGSGLCNSSDLFEIVRWSSYGLLVLFLLLLIYGYLFNKEEKR